MPRPVVASPRIPPVEPPYTADAAAQLARWMPPCAAVEPLKLFQSLTQYVPLAQAAANTGYPRR